MTVVINNLYFKCIHDALYYKLSLVHQHHHMMHCHMAHWYLRFPSNDTNLFVNYIISTNLQIHMVPMFNYIS